MRHLLCIVAFLLSTGSAFAASDTPSELTDYVFKPDPSFSWKVADRTTTDQGAIYTLDVVSQTWHDIKWEHKLQIYVPKNVKPQATMVLWNEGGKPGLTSGFLGLQLSAKVNAPIAILFGIPNQPLYGGKTEDKLIAETFVRYLETQDGSWPLLFPMVKSIIRGMDALQAFAKDEWHMNVENFLVAGASKRGWTTWLTAATGDKRVKAIAPLVIDTLDIPLQMKNQVLAFGKPSEMIAPYVERKLVPIPKTEAAQRLWFIIDPWSYRERLTMPKMIVNGTNDPYWPLDALNTYWDGLKGDKWVLYVPNAGHELRERDRDGKTQTFPTRALNTLSAFARSQVYDKPMPKLECSITCPPATECLDFNLQCSVKPLAAYRYTAVAKTRDFRQSYWQQTPLDLNDKKATCKIEPPKMGYSASLLDLEFDLDGLKYDLSTTLRILEPAK